MNNFGLYLVMTNPVVGYQACCEAAVRAGVKMVQLRMKDSPRDEILQTAKDLVSITKGSETKLIVNDDPCIAAESGADGVHVGQDDMPIMEVRKRFPELSIVGLSTHNLTQAIAAEALNPDYIGVGPVYPTPTKKIPDPVLGIERAMEMIKSVSMPAVAIGGLNLKTLPAVIRAGAQNWAIVRAVCESTSPYDAIRAVQEITQ